MKLSTLLAVTAAGLTTVGYAQTERDLDSHEHGSATLNVAVDNTEIFLEIETPWNNLVGFEHKPGTDEQYAMVSEAWAQLNAPEGLFTMNDGDCSISEVSAETSMPIEPHDEEHHGDGHEDHHDDAHGDEKDDHHELCAQGEVPPSNQRQHVHVKSAKLEGRQDVVQSIQSRRWRKLVNRAITTAIFYSGPPSSHFRLRLRRFRK